MFKGNYFNINKNKNYLKWTIVFFILWIICTGPIRNFGKPENTILQIMYGSAPNIFAGISFVLWIKYTTSSNLLYILIASFLFLVIGEIIQIFMENQTADVNDIIASSIGCIIGAIIVKSIRNKKDN